MSIAAPSRLRPWLIARRLGLAMGMRYIVYMARRERYKYEVWHLLNISSFLDIANDLGIQIVRDY